MNKVGLCVQAKVSFQDDMDGMQLGGAKEEKRMSLEHTLASLLATPARRNDEAVVSGKRTKKKKGRVETPQGSDSSARDSFSPGASAAGDLQDCALPLTFDAEDQMEDEEDQGSSRIEGAPEQPPCSPAAKEAGAAFVTFLTSAVGQGSFNFDSAMEKMFQNALILQNEVVSCSIPASVALEVMTQANEFMGAMLNKEDSLLNSVETATEALQSIGFSLSVLACTIEQTLGQKCGVELGGAREELLENVLKLFGACLQRWSFASAEEAGEKSLRKRPKVDRDARFSRMLSSAAAASLQALNKGSQDASNDRHRLSIMKISMDALVCDQVPSVQMEGIKLLKSMFSCNTKHREAILDEVDLPPL